MRRVLLSVLFANSVFCNPVRDHPRAGQGWTKSTAVDGAGAGTGVTAAIAPPGGVREGCQSTLADGKRSFGFAVELMMNGQWVNMASLPPGSSTLKSEAANADAPLLPMVRSTATTLVTQVPKFGEGVARGVDAADGILTIESTRTHTMTVMLNPKHSAAAAPVSPPSNRLVALYQIGDGQVQARVPAGDKAIGSSGGKDGGMGMTSPKSGTKSGPPKGPAGRGGFDQEQSISGNGRGFGPDDLDSFSGPDGGHAQTGNSRGGKDHTTGGMGGVGGMGNMDKMGGTGGTHNDDRLGLEIGRGGGLQVPEQEQLGGSLSAQDQEQLGSGLQFPEQDQPASDLLPTDNVQPSDDLLPSDNLQPSDDLLPSENVQPADDLLPADTANLNKREVSNEEPAKILSVNLNNGILKDAMHRTGYISGGDPQLQFDDPPQAGAVYTAGFSVCQESDRLVLSLGQRDRFHACLSGSFYNLYQYMEKPMGQCVEARITLLDLQSSSSGGPFYERLAIA